MRSMTGFGEAKRIEDGYQIAVLVRSVNYRYLEQNLKIPHAYQFLGEAVRTAVSKEIYRGKVDVHITVEDQGERTRNVTANVSLAKAYYDASLSVAEHLGLSAAPIDINQILAQRDVLSLQETREIDTEKVTKLVLSVLAEALSAFTEMRAREGANLLKSMATSLEIVQEEAVKLRGYEEESVRLYQERLEKRLADLVAKYGFGEDRILTEAAIFAEKVSIAEEIVRLESHTEQMEALFDTEGACGRKMDFLAQEMNREINTVSSKSQHGNINEIVVMIKAEIEKLREQIQNIE